MANAMKAAEERIKDFKKDIQPVTESPMLRGIPPSVQMILDTTPFTPQEKKKKTEEVRNALTTISTYTANPHPLVFTSDSVARLFIKNPQSFVDIAKIVGKGSQFATCDDVFQSLDFSGPARLLGNNPTAFIELVRAAKNDGTINLIFGGQLAAYKEQPLSNTRIKDFFEEYITGGISLNKLLLTMYSQTVIAVETGRRLDELHDKDQERKKVLNSLSRTKVFGLLTSDPELFYTSSNHLLFDRLLTDLGTTSVSTIFQENQLFNTEEGRNFLFRAINYDRLYGGDKVHKPLLKNPADVTRMLDTLLSPISSNKYDDKYYYKLANALYDIGHIPNIRPILIKQLSDRLESLNRVTTKSEDQKRVASALEYLLFKLDNNTPLISEERKKQIVKGDDKATFNPRDYMQEIDGKTKLVVVQVFDREDTAGDHWPLTQYWYGKKFGLNPTIGKNGEVTFKKKPKIGEHGELIFEDDSTRVVLFMGKNADENQTFISSQLAQGNGNMIITDRSHSFHLMDNFPSDIFGNMQSHILFIPGSCGSAGSTPEYIAANPSTDLRFVSNTSTGRGEVTNAIIDALTRTKQPTKFRDVLAPQTEVARTIESYGGNVGTIKVFGPGEALLHYVSGS